MKKLIKTLLNENLFYNLLESYIEEDYPTNFNLDHFKTLRKYSERVRYCDENLKKISSGSGRIVYIVDDTKVLKLAKNTKGVAQCEVEIQWGNDSYFGGILARTLDSHPDGLWVEMELARKVSKPIFRQLVGVDIHDLEMCLRNFGQTQKGKQPLVRMDPEIESALNENEFVNDIKDLMQQMDAPAGDLGRLNSYGLVKRDCHDSIVVVDFGLTNDVYSDYYDRSSKRY